MYPLFKMRERINHQGKIIAPGDFISWFLRVTLIWIIVVLMVPSYLPAFGQTETSLDVLAPEIEDFPVVSIQFKLDSKFVPDGTGLQTEQLTVLENEKPAQGLSLAKEYAGVYFILAINGARDLDLRDTFGISVYEKLSDGLIAWAFSRHDNFQDTWSLVNNEGTGIHNLDSPDDWVKALGDYQPNFRTMEPNLTSLETGIRLASERVVPFGVDKTLLYISPPPAAEEINAVNAFMEEARLAGLQVNVWMVGDELFLDNDQGKVLMNLANNTGGQFYRFMGVETLPDLETYLEHLGYTHTLTYDSGIRETGTYPVTLEVSFQEQIIRGESIPFYIEVSPPNPILVSPPVVITREAVIDEADQNIWSPNTFEINIMVDFPDDHPREIAVSRLYVDGDIMTQQTAPPFEVLTWNLAELTESGEHTIQVEVEDEWGLSNRSIITPVQIEVVLPEPSPKIPFQQYGLAVVSLVLASAVIVLLIWLARRGWKVPHFKRSKAQLTGYPGSSSGKPSDRLMLGGKIFATLIPLSSTTEDLDQSSLAITQNRVIFGTDPTQADIVLHQPDIAGLHADLYVEHGSFWLRDLGSPLGTWVNYNRVGAEAVQIRAGDIIHFGKSGFRFTMVGTGTLVDVGISRYEPIL